MTWADFYEKGKLSWFFTKTKINFLDDEDFFGNNFLPLKDELLDQNLVFLQDNVSVQ